MQAIVFIELLIFAILRDLISRALRLAGLGEAAAILGSIVIALALLVGWLMVRKRAFAFLSRLRKLR